MNRFAKKCFTLALNGVIFAGSLLFGSGIPEKPVGDSSSRLPGLLQHLGLRQNSPFRNLKWRFIGPVWMSGRVSDVTVSENQTIWVATASGGVWKSNDRAKSWQPLLGPTSSIGDIDISQADPEIIWVGTGESNSSRSTYSGTGVYKSLDGGKTWKHMGLSETHYIGRIVIHPKNQEIVYVAALGHLYSYNRERGIYLTRDGGRTWVKILYVDECTGFIDLAMDPGNSDILYAVSWDRLRKAWNLWEAGPGSGIYKTTDGGVTWKKCLTGLPDSGKMGRIGIAVSRSSPNVVYALLDNHTPLKKAGKRYRDPYGFKKDMVIYGVEVYRSEDRGNSWKKVNRRRLNSCFQTLGYYFGQIRVDPENRNTLYVLGMNLLSSRDGGKTFSRICGPMQHEDHHALWIDPANTRHLIDGNDGGINISFDGGRTWTDIDNLPVVQFYRVNVDQKIPFQVYGSAQDHGCFTGPVTHDPQKDNPRQWQKIPGGEASFIAVDPLDSNIVYSEGLYGSLIRWDRRKNRTKAIKPELPKIEPELRCNWLTPFVISCHDTAALYFGSQFLFYSGDRGDHWRKISPDLTKNDPVKRGDVPFGTITTISESRIDSHLIYAGTDDGNVQVTRNGGKEWNLVVDGLPENRWVTRILASRYRCGRVFVSLSGSRDDDYQPFLFQSSDFGKNWESIAHNLPAAPVNVLLEDPSFENIFYAGTDLGVYISLDLGNRWLLLSAGLPNLYVTDMVIQERDRVLVVATHGRGIFTLDLNSLEW